MVTAHFFPNCKDLILQIYMRRDATNDDATVTKRENLIGKNRKSKYRKLAAR